MDFRQEYERIVDLVVGSIKGYLSHDPGVPSILQEAIMYSLQTGGKRIRPVMVILSCEACDGEEVVALPAAVAMEMVHTYSLIHDDLPAMDNDDFRRGHPTNHKVFGEGIAMLAGDALLTHSFNILASHVQDDSLCRRLVRELSEAAGASGMIGGQVADLNAANSTSADLETVRYIHIHKTAMIFRASMRMGALCAGAEEQLIDRLGDFGLKMGLAFQIIDDLLDVTGTMEEVGKQTQKDEKSGKLTYPSILGLEESRNQANLLMAEAEETIKPLREKALHLRNLLEMLTKRRS